MTGPIKIAGPTRQPLWLTTPGWCCSPWTARPRSSLSQIARTWGSEQASWLVGDDDPHGQVKHQAGAAEHGQQHEQHPYQGRIDVEVLSQAATDPGQLPVGLAAVQLAGRVHGAAFPGWGL
jgi:hypothetical protein